MLYLLFAVLLQPHTNITTRSSQRGLSNSSSRSNLQSSNSVSSLEPPSTSRQHKESSKDKSSAYLTGGRETAKRANQRRRSMEMQKNQYSEVEAKVKTGNVSNTFCSSATLCCIEFQLHFKLLVFIA